MTNEVIETIMKRRSHRLFLPNQINNDELETILAAGLFAPSNENEQPWYFTVVQKQELLNEMSNKIKEILKSSNDDIHKKIANNENLQIFYDAPTVIFVAGDVNGKTPETDTASAASYMVLAAESLDIGSCWIKLSNVLFDTEQGEEYERKLGIPKAYKVSHAIAIGYKKVELNNPQDRKPYKVNYIK